MPYRGSNSWSQILLIFRDLRLLMRIPPRVFTVASAGRSWPTVTAMVLYGTSPSRIVQRKPGPSAWLSQSLNVAAGIPSCASAGQMAWRHLSSGRSGQPLRSSDDRPFPIGPHHRRKVAGLETFAVRGSASYGAVSILCYKHITGCLTPLLNRDRGHWFPFA
jgi:hypothetical protein